MRFTRPGGTVIVVGMPGLAQGVDWTAMWHKQLDVRGTYTSEPATFSRAIDLAVGLDDRLAPLVGATYPLESWREALAGALDTGASGVLKSAFQP